MMGKPTKKNLFERMQKIQDWIQKMKESDPSRRLNFEPSQKSQGVEGKGLYWQK
jgi:hypothetical protein